MNHPETGIPAPDAPAESASPVALVTSSPVAPVETRRWAPRLVDLAVGAGISVLFLGAWLLINGYEFGTLDHAIHLPYVLRAQAPDFLPGDPLVEAGSHHPSLLWTWLAWGTQWLPIEPLYFALHLASALGLFWGTVCLARALYPGRLGRWAAALAPAVMVAPKLTLTWIPTFDNHLLNRTLALGPELLALALAASGRFRAAFLLTGAVFILHPTTASHTALLVWFAALMDRRHHRALFTGPLFFLLGASPLLAQMLFRGSHGGVPFPAPEDWMHLNRLQLFFHHFPSTWTFEDNWERLAPLVFVLGAWQARVLPRAAAGFILGALVACIAGWVGLEWLHHPAALQLHLQQASRLMNFVAAVCGAAWVAKTWVWSLRRPPFAALALVAYVLDYNPAILILGLLALVLGRGPERDVASPPRWAPAAAVFGIVASMWVTAQLLDWHVPAVQVRFDELPGSRVMAWSRENLPEDAVVVTPPYFTHAMAAYRYGARRQVLANYKDGSEVSFSMSFLRQWRERMEALCDCKPFDTAPDASSLQAWLSSQDAVLAGYRNADAARFLELARRFGATHAVVERSEQEEEHRMPLPPGATPPAVAQPDLPLLYQDDEFSVYRIDAVP
ncbi:hypothetical protein A176_001628 [Myxococcus hansupus]|uniref:DUF6798 domain-containing protein n=1 Tax=Pseudomyxococcus hansupus TaxID=1297742 RepID=A0A0H4WMS8_9BACT|nr:DUF6798 domain-containing protein [Myxococcus hansupus]AKQ64716.1 hypothetical protein A176_001628 [Myxococcus hansupus]